MLHYGSQLVCGAPGSVGGVPVREIVCTTRNGIKVWHEHVAAAVVITIKPIGGRVATMVVVIVFEGAFKLGDVTNLIGILGFLFLGSHRGEKGDTKYRDYRNHDHNFDHSKSFFCVHIYLLYFNYPPVKGDVGSGGGIDTNSKAAICLGFDKENFVFGIGGWSEVYQSVVSNKGALNGEFGVGGGKGRHAGCRVAGSFAGERTIESTTGG